MTPPSEPPPTHVPPPDPAWSRTQWTAFLAALFGPPLLTSLAAMMDHRGAAAPALMFLGGAAGGVVAGIMLGCRFGKTPPAKVGLSVLLAGVTVVAVIAMCGFGCALGNYRLDFK